MAHRHLPYFKHLRSGCKRAAEAVEGAGRRLDVRRDLCLVAAGCWQATRRPEVRSTYMQFVYACVYRHICIHTLMYVYITEVANPALQESSHTILYLKREGAPTFRIWAQELEF